MNNAYFFIQDCEVHFFKALGMANTKWPRKPEPSVKRRRVSRSVVVTVLCMKY